MVWLRLTFLCIVLVACGQGSSGPATPPANKPPTNTPPTNNPSAKASLELRIAGLSQGVAAAVQVSGPNGFAQSVSASQTLSGLAAGSYSISYSQVQNSNATQVFFPSSGTFSISLNVGESKVANIGYVARYLADNPDDSSDYQIHVVYAVPKDGQDRRLDINGQIANSVSSVQTWLKGQAGGRGLRLDTFGGKPDITFVRLSQTDAQLKATNAYARDFIEAELMSMGFISPKKIYAVYYDGSNTHSCGGGAWPPVLFGTVGIVYLNGAPTGFTPCNQNPLGSSPTVPQYLDFSMLHEVFHTLGAVQECAPNHTRAGHSSDSPTDLMYAGDQAWRPSVLDPGKNDYFGHGRTDCADIAKSTFLEPALTGATPPPGWPFAEIANAGCSQEGSLASRVSTTTKVMLVNGTAEALDVFWIDYSGQPRPSGTLAAFAKFNLNTFEQHPWLIRSKAGACKAIFMPSNLLGQQGVAVVR